MVKRYLDKLSLNDAVEKMLNRFKDLKADTEIISTNEAVGRITAESVKALRSAPDYYASAMDGIAVKAKDTAGASERNPVILKKEEAAVLVDTGDPVPEEFDAVIKIEEVNEIDKNTYTIEKGVPTWNNIRSIGESVVKGQLILTAGHKLRDYDLGALLEAGVTELKVYKKPSVTIIPTGDELVKADSQPKRGELVEFNSVMVKAALNDWGAEVYITEIIADQKELIKKKVLESLKDSEMVIVLSGSSAGREDYTINLLKESGDIIFHGVNIMPGKPVIMAELEKKAVVGLPGYPISAWIVNQLFIKKLIYSMQGLKAPDFNQIKAEVNRKVPSDIGLEEFLRVNLIPSADDENRYTAVPLPRGSSAMESIVNADAILRIAENKEGLAPGDKAPAILLNNKENIKNDLLIIGSHDLSLDLIRNKIAANGAGFRLKIQTVGSMAGLTALRRKESHLAGAHLLDVETGEYNISYLKRFFKGKKMALINLVFREQGFYLKKGNPKNFKNINDLTREDINFVNRQRGAGTRVLLDYLLEKENIKSSQIAGYNKEEYTHIAAAAAVGRGSADAALGIRAAAEVMDVNFLAAAEEQYDIILEERFLEDSRVKYLLSLLNDNSLKKEIEDLGGYSTDKTGTIRIIEV
ncbi:MAG: molybdopterin biosynthesis protein [Halanaerobium sp.]